MVDAHLALVRAIDGGQAIVTKRILHIIPTLDPHGSRKAVDAAGERLAARSIRRSRLRIDARRPVRSNAGPRRHSRRRCLHKRWKLDPAAYWRLKRHIARLRPDLVHTWLFAANCYGRVAARQAGVRRIVASERCVDRWKMWHELAIDRRLARHTDRIVANSRAVRDFYVAHGIAAEKFAVIPNGIRAGGASSSLSRADLLAEFGLPAGCETDRSRRPVVAAEARQRIDLGDACN